MCAVYKVGKMKVPLPYEHSFIHTNVYRMLALLGAQGVHELWVLRTKPLPSGSSHCTEGTRQQASNLWHSVLEVLLLLLLSCFSRVRLCVIPQTAAHQVSLSLGFSRQEHCSGLPFPSPMHESKKWKWSCSVVSDSLRPHGLAAYQAPTSMGFSRQEYWSGEEDTQVTNKQMKRCSTSLAVGEMQIETTMRQHFIHTRVATVRKSDNNKDVEKLEPRMLLVGM